jgi:hypothetical protein
VRTKERKKKKNGLSSKRTWVNEIKDVVGRAGKETGVGTTGTEGIGRVMGVERAAGAAGAGAGDASRLRGLAAGGGGTKNEEVRDGDTRALADVRSAKVDV